MALVKGKLESSMLHCLGLFTDEEGAVDFRDEHYPGWPMGAVPDEKYLATLLMAIRDKVTMVAFDPYKMGNRTTTIPLNVLLEQLEA